MSIKVTRKKGKIPVDALLSKNQNLLKSAIPLVKIYDKRLDSLNHWWGKISLIGQINSHNVSDSILEEMHHTKDKFSELQGELIQNLLKEHLQKRIADDHNKSQVAIDILIRNLFERTADVGFLATDDDIRTFLLKENKQPEDMLAIQSRLAEYVKKYSVYDEIIILDTNGVVQANLDTNSGITQSFDSLIVNTLTSSEEYTETFGKSDLQPNRAQSLIYSCAIKSTNEDNAQILGVLCLCFRFDDEMQSIFKHLQPSNATSNIMIIDNNGEIIASNNPQKFSLGTNLKQKKSPHLMTFKHQAYLSTTTATKGYQGFNGLSWCGQVVTSLQDAFIHSEEIQRSPTESFDLLNSQLFSAQLKAIYKTSELVKDDLNLVVLNGIIAAARNNAVEFMPVLTEIKKTGE
ncbi:MAG: cache domain-containing protein, partial [Paraglaciecola sp.]|nr:cache domain-containing protein [Paraglaciecola sp.]